MITIISLYYVFVRKIDATITVACIKHEAMSVMKYPRFLLLLNGEHANRHTFSIIILYIIYNVLRYTLGSFFASPLITEFACVGEQTTLTCHSLNSTHLKWEVSNPHTTVTGIGTEIISSTQVLDHLPPIVSNLGVFQFVRTSNSSPLSSVLHINNITVQLNGTTLKCSDLNNMILAEVTIIVSPGQTYY